MAERDLESKIEMDHKVADATIEQSKTGTALAFLLTLVALVAAIVFFALGNDIAGGVLLGLPVVMLIRSFIGSIGRKSGTPPDGSFPSTQNGG